MEWEIVGATSLLSWIYFKTDYWDIFSLKIWFNCGNWWHSWVHYGTTKIDTFHRKKWDIDDRHVAILQMYCIDFIQRLISYRVLVALGAEGLALGLEPIQRDRDQTIGTTTDIPCPRTSPDPGLVPRICGTGTSGTGTFGTGNILCHSTFWYSLILYGTFWYYWLLTQYVRWICKVVAFGDLIASRFQNCFCFCILTSRSWSFFCAKINFVLNLLCKILQFKFKAWDLNEYL